MAGNGIVNKSRSDTRIVVKGLWWKLGTGIWMAAAILAAFLMVGPARGFMLYGHGAKIIFFHVPCAWLATLAYIVGAVYATKCLAMLKSGDKRASEADFKCASAMELGLLFAALATITGSIFSQNEWHIYWNWDPRQTSIVVVLLIYAAYCLLRGALDEPEKRARLSSAYALVALVPGIFLLWVLPRIVSFTMHSGPNEAVVGGGLTGGFRLVLYLFMLPSFIGMFIWLFQLRLRYFKIDSRLEG